MGGVLATSVFFCLQKPQAQDNLLQFVWKLEQLSLRRAQNVFFCRRIENCLSFLLSSRVPWGSPSLLKGSYTVRSVLIPPADLVIMELDMILCPLVDYLKHCITSLISTQILFFPPVLLTGFFPGGADQDSRKQCTRKESLGPWREHSREYRGFSPVIPYGSPIPPGVEAGVTPEHPWMWLKPFFHSTIRELLAGGLWVARDSLRVGFCLIQMSGSEGTPKAFS